MRLSVGFSAIILIALAGCASPPKTNAPAPAVSADAGAEQTASTAKKLKTCLITGSRLCTHEQEVDPSVMGMSSEALGDAERGHPLGYSAPR